MADAAPEHLEDLVARLERERADADRAYNDALTAFDRALTPPPQLPRPLAPARTGSLPASDSASHGKTGGLLGRWVARLLRPQLAAQSAFNAAVAARLDQGVASDNEVRDTIARLLDAVSDAFDRRAAVDTRLVLYLQTITAFVDSKDRSLAGPELRARLGIVEQRLMAMKRDAEQSGGRPVSAGSAPGRDKAFESAADSATYSTFEDRFRGARHEIRTRLEDYLPLLTASRDIVDVGCGRGELLDLLKAHDVAARGVDTNRAMVDECVSRGLAVEYGDALGFLNRQGDGAIGGVVAIQVVEHFEPAYLMRFLEAAFHKMRTGAPLVLETINPACWMAFFETYIRDLTHVRPLHPDTLKYLVEASGFQNVDVRFRQPVREQDRLKRAPTAPAADGPAQKALADAINDHADKLNARLFSSMDYAIVARR